MRKFLAATLLAAMTAGCGGSEEIWVFYVDPPADPVSTTTIDHNFIGAQPYAGTTTGGDWTNTTTVTASPGIMFGQIVKVSGDDDVFLIIGDIAIPGQKAGGQYQFSWPDTYTETDREQHVSGYTYEDTTSSTSTTTVTMALSGGTATGTWMNTGTSTRTWTETDTWDINTVGTSSQMNPSNYIEGTDGSYISNDYTTADCSGNPCRLAVTNTSSQTSNFRAERTKYADEDAFAGVQDASDPGGNF
ncbi:MAG: hypothetical protein EP330_08855 [Deltaproteobacteria bacterium]|nr:MAG: hypothetical protein EP330_08855 [Deltaproteobacteria bacterium]